MKDSGQVGELPNAGTQFAVIECLRQQRPVTLFDDRGDVSYQLFALADPVIAALDAICAETFDVAVNGHITGETTITPEAIGRIYETARIALEQARRAA